MGGKVKLSFGSVSGLPAREFSSSQSGPMSSRTPADYLAGIPQAAVDYSPILPQFGFLDKVEPSAEKQSVEKMRDANARRKKPENPAHCRLPSTSPTLA